MYSRRTAKVRGCKCVDLATRSEDGSTNREPTCQSVRPGTSEINVSAFIIFLCCVTNRYACSRIIRVAYPVV